MAQNCFQIYFKFLWSLLETQELVETMKTALFFYFDRIYPVQK